MTFDKTYHIYDTGPDVGVWGKFVVIRVSSKLLSREKNRLHTTVPTDEP